MGESWLQWAPLVGSPLEITLTSIFPHQTCSPYTKGISDRIIVPRQDANGVTSGLEWGQRASSPLWVRRAGIWIMSAPSKKHAGAILSTPKCLMETRSVLGKASKLRGHWALSREQCSCSDWWDVRRSALQLFLGNCEISSTPRRTECVLPGSQVVLTTYHSTDTCSPEPYILQFILQCEPWTSNISVTWALVRRPRMQKIGLQEEKTGKRRISGKNREKFEQKKEAGFQNGRAHGIPEKINFKKV